MSQVRAWARMRSSQIIKGHARQHWINLTLTIPPCNWVISVDQLCRKEAVEFGLIIHPSICNGKVGEKVRELMSEMK